MKLFFKEKIAEKSEDCGSREQCMGPTDVHRSQKKSQQPWLKRKKKKKKRKILKSENVYAQT